MSDTRALLTRIAAFRERLDAQPRLVPMVAVEEASELVGATAETLAADPALMAHALRRMTPPEAVKAWAAPELTQRARQLLEDARELVAVQRRLADDPTLATGDADAPAVGYHRETVALTEAALSLAQGMPASAEGQLRACEGLEALVETVRDRLAVLHAAVRAEARDAAELDGLARRLGDLARGRLVDLAWFVELAQTLLEDARQAAPLRFLSAPVGDEASRFVAAHALTVAQVVARVVPHDYEWAAQPVTPVLAALLMDLGMVTLDAELLGQAAPLTPAQRRKLDAHAQAGADQIRSLFPDSELVAQAIAAHHERPDGTGYPNALGGAAIPPLAAMLAACDHYAARACDRPHRPAADPRTALVDTLLAAEEGRLDRDFSELLLHLGFYPTGTVVELTDGRVARVVANRGNRTSPHASTRPAVAVVADRAGRVLPRPEFVDLAAAERGSVVRALDRAERRSLLARHYPELAR